jgi:hypothetical protein
MFLKGGGTMTTGDMIKIGEEEEVITALEDMIEIGITTGTEIMIVVAGKT